MEEAVQMLTGAMAQHQTENVVTATTMDVLMMVSDDETAFTDLT